MTDLLWAGPDSGPTLVLAHSAGSAMDSPWMNDFCGLLSDRGVRTVRFEFAYMASRRVGVRKPTPRADLVAGEYRAAVDAVVASVGGPVFIGGKSYGGRVASLVADEVHDAGSDRAVAVAGLVCLGYPFHPPDKPEQLRTAHLEHLATPTLICQGTRDPFGSRDEVAGYALSTAVGIHWLEDGDHDFRPRKALSGRTFAQNLAEAADAVSSLVEPVET